MTPISELERIGTWMTYGVGYLGCILVALLLCLFIKEVWRVLWQK